MGTSIESRRTSVYSEDLKQRIVWQKEVLGCKCKDVAVNLGVDTATVSQTVDRFRETGGVQRKDDSATSTYSKLMTPLELMTIHLVLRDPGIHLCEIAFELLDTTGADIYHLSVSEENWVYQAKAKTDCNPKR